LREREREREIGGRDGVSIPHFTRGSVGDDSFPDEERKPKIRVLVYSK
jgi:hypothetical protein